MSVLPLVALLAIGLSGCATDSLDLAPATPQTPYTEAAVVGGQAQPGPAGASRPEGDRPDFGLPAKPSLAILGPPAETGAGQVYDLPDLIDLAETSNPSTRIAWEQARSAALAVGEVRATYLPTIAATVVGGYQRSSGSTATSLTSGPLDGAGTSSTTGSDLKGTVSSVSLRWLLFDFGQRDARVEAARQHSVTSDVAFNASHQKIIYDVARQFYEYSAARDAAHIYVAARRDAQAVLDAAKSRFSFGLGTSLEVAQGKQLLAQAVYGEVSSNGSARDSYSSLLSAMGVSPLTVLRVRDVSARPIGPGSAATVDRLVTDALARRTDVRQAFAELEASKADIKVAEREFLPKVFMSASGTYTSGTLDINALPGLGDGSPTSTQTNRSNATVLGGITMPLYDGGTRAARLLQARAGSDIAEQRLTLTQQNAAHEIVVASNAVRSSTESYRAASALVAASKVTYDAALASYKTGLGDITSALDAQKSLLQARVAQARAHATALIAAASLAFATGSLTNSTSMR